ncbi:MAG: hypothetical protein ACJ77K_17620 [Bacteroidia bacterium]
MATKTKKMNDRVIDLTIKDFEALISKTVQSILKDQDTKHNPHIKKEFYSPKEFSHATGIPYSTVVYRCKLGKLKARQDDPNCSWQIFASELDRYKEEANDNTI